jgi:ribA/ribD-fused uncharacterized protein
MSSQILFYNENEMPYGCFSNYYLSEVNVFGKRWKTTEHAFQASKFPNLAFYQKIYEARTPTEAKRIGTSRDSSNPIRPDWESVKDSIMYECVKAKFEQNLQIQQILLGTGNATLIEHTKNDRYWADGGDGSGLNKLGQILMKVRDEIRQNIVPSKLATKGKIRVGRRKYIGKTFTESNYPGFTPVIVIIRDYPQNNEFGALSPYWIRTPPTEEFPQGVIVENFWQFLKVYPSVTPQQCPRSTNDPKIVFEHGFTKDKNGKLTKAWNEEIHIREDGSITPEWDAWRKKGLQHKVGFVFL